jgi:hypothetical protein
VGAAVSLEASRHLELCHNSHTVLISHNGLRGRCGNKVGVAQRLLLPLLLGEGLLDWLRLWVGSTTGHRWLLLLGFRLGVAGAPLRLLLFTDGLAWRGARILLTQWLLLTARDRGRLVTQGGFGQRLAAGARCVLLAAAWEGRLLAGRLLLLLLWAGRLLLADGHAGRLLLLLLLLAP